MPEIMVGGEDCDAAVIIRVFQVLMYACCSVTIFTVHRSPCILKNVFDFECILALALWGKSHD